MLWYYINTTEVCSHQSLILKRGYCSSIKLSHSLKLAQENNPAAVLQWFMLASTDMPFPLCHACLKLLNFSWLGFEEFEEIPVWYILGKQNSAFKSRQTRPMEGKRRGVRIPLCAFGPVIYCSCWGSIYLPPTLSVFVRLLNRQLNRF